MAAGRTGRSRRRLPPKGRENASSSGLISGLILEPVYRQTRLCMLEIFGIPHLEILSSLLSVLWRSQQLEWQASINKIPFIPFLHKIHSKRANEHQEVWSICTFCIRKQKTWQNKKGGKKIDEPRETNQKHYFFQIEKHLFYNMKNGHKRIKTSTASS